MADEARKISIQVQATQAINQLTKLGAALEKIGSAVGSSDAVLRNLDSQLTRIPGVTANASSALANLKKEVQGLSTAQKTMNAAGKTPTTGILSSANKSNVSAITQENLRLASSFDAIRASAAKAATANVPKIGKLAAAPLVQTPQGYFPNGAVPLKMMNKELAVTAAATNQATRGVRSTAAAVDELGQNVQQNALRYQLYDVAATLGVVGAAALTSGTAVTRAGIQWDKNFANVVRTSQVTGTAVTWLKDQFLDLQTIVPVSSEDLANIATLGAQMGVAASNLTNFTRITAQFSATAGINVDESATALSRLNQLLPDVGGNYEKLASTILRTGVNAVATEQQITRGTSQIASMGQIAGLTTPEVVALSSAMSSLGFSPELQRSVITSSFSRILTATSEVTAKTEQFGAVLNMTGKQFQAAWRSDAIGTFQNLLVAIAQRGDAVTVLKSLGLASQRLTPNLLKMGQNSEVLSAALSDTRDEWNKNTEQARQYGIISATVSARLQILGQSWEALLVTLDDSDVVLKPIIDGLTAIVKWLGDVAATPGVSALASLGTALVTLSGVVALGAAAMAGMAAGYIAITNAARGLTAMTSVNSGATAINTTTIIGNTLARDANVGATAAQTGAIAGNTAAMGANGAAATGAGAGMLGFTGKVIQALGPILKWTTILGAAAAALTGFVAIASTAPDWMLDLEQAMSGIDTPEKKVKFDTKRIVELSKASKQAAKDQKKAQQDYTKYMADQNAELDKFNKRVGPRNERKAVGPLFGGRQVGGEAAEALSQAKLKSTAAMKNLEKALMDIKDPTTQLRALNEASKDLGISTGDLLKKLPGLNSLLGDGAVAAAAMEDETVKLEAAQALWANSLNTSPELLKDLQAGVTGAAKSFMDFGGALTDAYDKDKENGEGFGSFVKTMNSQITGFEKFYGNLGKLVQRGGIQLATLFASQGPAASQALADSLKLKPAQLAQIEEQMELAAFYASKEFADTFSQNNAILAEVWTQSGHNPKAVAAFNKALADTMKNGSIDPAALAALADKFGIKLNVDMLPQVDEDQFNAAQALLHADIKPIKLPVTTSIGQGDFTATKEVDAWVVEMEGHKITMTVNPNTSEGRSIIAKWRENEYRDPIDFTTKANTTTARQVLDAMIGGYVNRTYYLNFMGNFSGFGGKLPDKYGARTAIATGGLIHNGDVARNNYPRYASGTIFRGPGSGTSDSILALVSDGEAITRARAVRYYGTRMMEDINNMRFPRYATGFTPSGSRGPEASQVINATVNQYYPTTRDPIRQLKQDAEAVISGIWT